MRNGQGRRLCVLTGGAFVVWVLVGLLRIPIPAFEPYTFLGWIVLMAIWAALCGLILFATARWVSRIAVLAALALAVVLSLSTGWFGVAGFLLAYVGAVVFGGAALVLVVLHLFRRRPGPGILLLPVTMIVAGIGGMLLASWSSRPAPAIPQQTMNVSDELKYISDTDQADRATGMFVVNMGRDRLRLERVKALYHSGKIVVPLDQYRAALVYQHATCADDYHVAYELANAAARHGVANSLWLSHAAYDRWQMSLGKWQTYGTQYMPIPEKRPCPRQEALSR